MKSAFKIRTKIQANLVEFWMAILAGPGRFMDSACALLADVVQVSSQKSAFSAHCLLMLFSVSSQKSAFKIRTKIQPNLIEFWVAILAGPRRFLDEISLQNSHNNSTKFD